MSVPLHTRESLSSLTKEELIELILQNQNSNQQTNNKRKYENIENQEKTQQKNDNQVQQLSLWFFYMLFTSSSCIEIGLRLLGKNFSSTKKKQKTFLKATWLVQIFKTSCCFQNCLLGLELPRIYCTTRYRRDYWSINLSHSFSFSYTLRDSCNDELFVHSHDSGVSLQSSSKNTSHSRHQRYQLPTMWTNRSWCFCLWTSCLSLCSKSNEWRTWCCFFFKLSIQ